MTDFLKKSTKTLTYTRHIPISINPEILTSIIKKYELDFKIVSAHKFLDHAEYIKPKKHVRIIFSSKEKLDYKLYSAMIEIDLHLYNDSRSQPFIKTKQTKLRQQYIDLRTQIINNFKK